MCSAIKITLLVSLYRAASAEECSAARSPAAEGPLEDGACLLQATHRVTKAIAIEHKEHLSVENQNLVYIKVPKTGSSTCSGVNRNIAAHHNLTGVRTECVWIAQNGEPGSWSDHMEVSAGGSSGHCEVDEEHGFTTDSLMENIKALEMPAFMWTMVREPAERALSNCYWVSAPREPTTAEKLLCLRLATNLQFKYIRPYPNSTLEEVLETYDFIGVNEYFDESMVALAAALRIPPTDVLYLASKNNTEGTEKIQGTLAVAHPPLEEEPEVVKEFVNGTFRQANSLDYQLYEHANRRLSALVATMELDEAIASYKSVLRQVQQACGPDDNSVYLANVTECYARDQGCNYECIDEESAGLLECRWCT